jgi:hypothetical protein
MGMAAYKKNTGSDYPVPGAIKTSRKRSTGIVPLTDASNYLWYGTIEVGTPPKAFEGMIFPSAISKVAVLPRVLSSALRHWQQRPLSTSLELHIKL